MSSTIVPLTCPKCGAGLSQLENMPERSRNNNPLFFYKCTECGHEFPLRSRHCMRIWKDTLAMEKINRDFFRTITMQPQEVL